MAAHHPRQDASPSSSSSSPRRHPQPPTAQKKRQDVDDKHRALSKRALSENDAMVYLDGPQVYTCGNCRTHLTSHDDIISKSFHGRHGRAYLFDQCVNISTGPAEDRILITGLHTVSDISCKRCRTLVGWTYAKAYENSQKYKEGKFIIEKIHLHLEENDVYYDVGRPAGERGDRWRVRSMSWGSERSTSAGSYGEATTTPVSSYSSSSSTTGGLYSRSRSGSGSGHHGGNNGPSTFDHPRPSPQTPVRRSPGATAAATLSPNSPGLPGDIIYEYR